MSGMSFESVVKTYADTVYRVALNILRNPEDSKDCMQNVFLRYYKKQNAFESDEHIKAWLIRVAVNESKRLLKINSKNQNVPLDEVADAFLIDNEEYVPYSNCMFSLYKSEGRFAGVLSFTYPYDKEELNVKINLPYLDASLQDSDEPLGRIESDFTFSFTVGKSYPDVLVYNADTNNDKVCVQGVTSSLGGITVEIFVPVEVENSEAGVVAAVTDSKGKSLSFISGEREKAEGGYIHKQYFEPTEDDVIDVTVYDKNDADGCGNSPCVLAELVNIELKSAE